MSAAVVAPASRADKSDSLDSNGRLYPSVKALKYIRTRTAELATCEAECKRLTELNEQLTVSNHCTAL